MPAVRDDLKKLPLPKEAKAYARRHGMGALKRQPQQFIDLMATLTNQKDKQRGFKNDDQGETVKHEFNEDVDQVINQVLEGEEESEFKDVFAPYKLTYYVVKTEDQEGEVLFEIDVPPMGPHLASRLINKMWLSRQEYTDDEMQAEVMRRLRALAKSRNYPPGSVFSTPWGRYRIGR